MIKGGIFDKKDNTYDEKMHEMLIIFRYRLKFVFYKLEFLFYGFFLYKCMEKTFQKKKKNPTKKDAINFFSFLVGCEDANQIQQRHYPKGRAFL